MRLERLLLVGPMGVGKTTVGKLLAEAMARDFLDCDREIEARAGADIPWIFDVEGEAGFRNRESALLEEVVKLPNLVIATGGGAVLRERNRRLIRDAGLVIHLHASLDLLVSRTAKNRNRPLLQAGDSRAILARLLEERQPLYQAVADISMEMDAGASKGETLKILLGALRHKGYLESA